MDYNWPWEIAKSVLMTDNMEKNAQKTGAWGLKIHKTSNICSSVTIVVQYLDNIIRIIFPKF